MYPITKAEINLDAISHNVKELRRITDHGARLMAVVKANAYGHGAIEVSKEAVASGVDFLGVARLQEAIELRHAGLNVPILIFGYTPPLDANQLVEYDLIQTVFSLQMAEQLSNALPSTSKPIRIHLKIDTGMGRLGFVHNSLSDQHPNQIIQDIRRVHQLSHLQVEGIYTHFAASDAIDKSYTWLQFNRFMELIEELRKEGIEFIWHHAANSGAIIDLPQMHLDMVRAGISLYGLYPSKDVNHAKINLKPAMTLKSVIVQVKDVPAGFNISYSMTYKTKTPTRIATVAIGYADGYSRLLSSRGNMLVHGKIAPIVGRVCMDHTMIDVGNISNVSVGDEVVVFGKQGNAEIPVDDIAEQTGTINYEVVSTITNRVERIYHRSMKSF